MADYRTISVSTTSTLAAEGRTVDPPVVQVVAVAVVKNPLSGKGFISDLSELEALGAEVAGELAERAVAALAPLGLSGADVRGYGKGAVVGTDGALEHTAAILHPKFGAPVRALIGGGADIIPGTKKVGGPGTPITMPIGNKDDRWVFDDMDSAEFVIGDAPRSDEIAIGLVLAVGGRPHARVRKP